MLFLDSIFLSILLKYFNAPHPQRLVYEELYFKPFSGVILVTIFLFLIVSVLYLVIIFGISSLSTKESIHFTNQIQLNFIYFAGVFIMYDIEQIQKNFLFYISICSVFHLLHFLAKQKLEKFATQNVKKSEWHRLMGYLLINIVSLCLTIIVVDDVLMENSIVFKSELFYVLIKDLQVICKLTLFFLKPDLLNKTLKLQLIQSFEIFSDFFTMSLIYENIKHQKFIFQKILMIRFCMESLF